MSFQYIKRCDFWKEKKTKLILHNITISLYTMYKNKYIYYIIKESKGWLLVAPFFDKAIPLNHTNIKINILPIYLLFLNVIIIVLQNNWICATIKKVFCGQSIDPTIFLGKGCFHYKNRPPPYSFSLVSQNLKI